jgi:DNA-binding beta-propeller fold protein YncE
MQLRSTTIAASLLLSSLALAQESYWIASRTSGTLDEIDVCGSVRQTVTLGYALRSAHVAPDGRIWVVRFGGSLIDVLNPDGTSLASPTYPLGAPYDIAFDRNGHAWVSGGTGVCEFDAAGNFVQQFPLGTGAPLGITVDADGNKWVAHRIGPPGSLSRIDAISGVVTVHPLAQGSAILPTKVYADFRGIGQSSHIWVIGDNRGAGELVEFDAAGNELNRYVVDGAGNFGGLVADVDPGSTTARYVYISDFRNGNIWQVDAATGAAIAYPGPVDSLGIAIDGFRNLWATKRTGAEVWRHDAGTGNFEVAAPVGAGVQSSLSTGWHYATTVDPLGDLDGDGTPNFAEALRLSSPFDPCSTPNVSLSVEGPTGIGTATAIRAEGTGVTAVAFGTARAASPLRVPGIGCTFQIELTTLLPVAVTIPAGTSLPLNIPADPGLVGLVLFAQGLNLTGGTAAFSNATCLKFY